jgi:hypothetical protein
MFKRSGGALQEVEVIKEAVALEPGQSCFELWQGNLGSPLAAEHPLQHRIVAMIQLPSICGARKPV